LVGEGVEGSELEIVDLNSLKKGLFVLEEGFTVVNIVEGLSLNFGVTDTSGVSSSDEVVDTTPNSGGCVPHDFTGATVEHGRRPDSEDDVLLGEGFVVDESLVLVNSGGERNIIILAPSTEGMEEEDGVLVALSHELLTGVGEEEAMSVMEGVSHLEGVDGISVSLNHDSVDLLGGHSVFIESVVPHNSLGEVHGGSGDKEISLLHDSFGHGVVLGEGSESSGADLFLSVVEELSTVDNGNDISVVGKGNILGSILFTLLLEFLSAVLGDGDRHEGSLSVLSNSLHLEALEELHVVHESLEGLGPSVSNSLDEFTLHLVNLKLGVSSSSFELGCVFDDKGLNNDFLSNSLENVLVDHVVNEHLDALVNRVTIGVDGEDIITLGLIVISGDTGEVRDDTGTSLYTFT